MQGLFRANGGCGYVKKPDILLRKDPYEFDPKADLPLKETLVVNLLSHLRHSVREHEALQHFIFLFNHFD